MSVCNNCKVEKPLEDFYRDNSIKRGYSYECKQCDNEKKKIYRANNKEKVKEWNNRSYSKYKDTQKGKATKRRKIYKRYKLTPEEYDKRIEQQQGKCAICENIPERSLQVDHNHLTNELRDLICFKCNALIGLSKENISTLEKAIKYLKRHNVVNLHHQ